MAYIQTFAPAAATGLTPTIRLRDLSDNSLTVTDAAMSEVGDGLYKYDFSAAVSGHEYGVRVDFGASYTNANSRYRDGYYSASSSGGATAQQVWEYQLSATPAEGTAAKYLRSSGPNIDVASGYSVGYNGLSAKDTVKEFTAIKEILAELKAKEDEGDDMEEEDDSNELNTEEIKRALSDEVRGALASVGDIGQELDNKVTVAVLRAVDGLKSDVMKYAKKQLSEEEEFRDILNKAELMAKIESLESSVERLMESDMMKTKQIEEKEKELEENRKKLEKLKSALD